jgi:hypothetical protein
VRNYINNLITTKVPHYIGGLKRSASIASLLLFLFLRNLNTESNKKTNLWVYLRRLKRMRNDGVDTVFLNKFWV